MKTYIIDWGKNSNGGRFALIQADSFENAWMDADCVGSPFKICELDIPENGDFENIKYMEFDEPKKAYAGSSPKNLKWKTSAETFAY